MKVGSTDTLTRALMTFHHIRSPRKKRFIAEQTSLHSLRGVCKVGHPGILVLVGEREGCEAVVRAIKKLTWASCHLRRISHDVSAGPLPQPHASSRTVTDTEDAWLLNGKETGCQMVDKMAEIGAIVRAAGWEDWWREGMSQGA